MPDIRQLPRIRASIVKLIVKIRPESESGLARDHTGVRSALEPVPAEHRFMIWVCEGLPIDGLKLYDVISKGNNQSWGQHSQLDS